jgi:hypothetical protein
MVFCSTRLEAILIVYSSPALAEFTSACQGVYIKLTLHLFDLLWICCGFVVQQAVRLVVKLWICCGFAVDLLYSFSICCGQVESHTPLFRFVVGFAVQLVVQQIHNKSNKWSLSLIQQGITSPILCNVNIWRHTLRAQAPSVSESGQIPSRLGSSMQLTMQSFDQTIATLRYDTFRTVIGIERKFLYKI